MTAFTPTATHPVIDAETVRDLAGGYLIDNVGDLLMPGSPRFEAGRWTVPIILGNARRGELGQVGTIAVDAATGEILFSDDERAQVKTRARSLADNTTP